MGIQELGMQKSFFSDATFLPPEKHGKAVVFVIELSSEFYV
jgi:hypothetical protein